MRFGVALGLGVICAGVAGVAACIGDSSDGGPNAGPDAGDGTDATPSTDDASGDAGGTDAADAADASTVMPCKSESSTRTILAQTPDAGSFLDVWMMHLSPTRIAIVSDHTGQGKSLLLYTYEPGDAGAATEKVIDANDFPMTAVPNSAHDGLGVIAADAVYFTLHEIDANGGDVGTQLMLIHGGYGSAALVPLGPSEWWFALSDTVTLGPPATNEIWIGHVKSGVMDGLVKVDSLAQSSHTNFRSAVRVGDRVLLFDDNAPDLTNGGPGTYYWDLPVDTSTATTTTQKIVGAGPSRWIVVGTAPGTTSDVELAIAEDQPDPGDPDFIRAGVLTPGSAIDPKAMLKRAFDVRWNVDVPFRPFGTRSRLSDHGNFVWVGPSPFLSGRGFDVYWYDYAAGALRARTTEIFGDRLGVGNLDAELVATPTTTSAEIDVVWIDQQSSLAYARVKCAR